MVGNFFRNSQRLLEKQHTNILSAASVITLAVMASSILGFVRTRLLGGYFYGAVHGLPEGAALDAYRVSFLVPDTVFQLLVVGALSAAFIPIYTKYQQRKSKQEALKLANSILNLILFGFIVLSIIIYIWAYQFNQLLTGPEFSVQQLAVATDLTRLMLLAQLFFAVSSFMTGFIQANQRFIVPAMAPLVYNLGIILGIVGLSQFWGIYAAAVGVIIGAGLHLLIQLPLALKLGYRYQPIVSWQHPGVKETARLMLPRTMALSVDQVESYVIVFLATTVPYTGGVWLMSIAQQLMKAPVRIFGVPIGQASLPFLSQESAKSDLSRYLNILTNSLLQIIYLSLPAAVLLLVLRVPLVRILYGVKDFPWEATLLTGRIVGILALAITAYALSQLLNRAFYALHNSSWPLLAAVLAVVTNVVVASVCLYYLEMGLIALAVGIVAGAWVNLILLITRLAQLLDQFFSSELVLPIVKMVFAASLMGIFLWIPMRLLDEILNTTKTLDLVMLTISATATGGMVYLWLSNLLEIKQQEAVIRLLDKLGNWRKVLSYSEETIESKPD